MAESIKYDGLEIAVIGMSGQFPKCPDCKIFWSNLAEGKDLITTFTDEQLKARGVSDAQLHSETYVKSEAILENKDLFDHGFFGYSTEESALMDPQIRLFHEHCWKALEDAGCASQLESRKIGLFAGASTNDNWKIYVYGKSNETSLDPFYLNMIKSQNFINTLVSYKLNLRGPSIYVDTACSTSLSAVHLACRSLLMRECTVALAGGVCIRTNKQKGYQYAEGMIASKDGYCRTFDAESTGTASGEGIGVVVLKRLSEAIKDRDHIYCIVKGSAVNNDGNLKVGYTAPSVQGQVECIMSAHKLAGITSSSISYVEAHGTGTKLGDPVEIRALNLAFGVGADEKFCAVGSVKSNMGHLDAAAGIAGFIKTALALQHKKLPPSLHFKSPNPEINFDDGPFYVNTALQEWNQKDSHPLRAGVSSLGIGGTNVHFILEEAPVPVISDPGRTYMLLNISAKTEPALLRYMQILKDHLLLEPEINLADLSYTLQTGRKHFAYRKSLLYEDRDTLVRLLEQGNKVSTVCRSIEKKDLLVFAFPGQGSQYINMGKDLYAKEQYFRAQMDKGFAFIEKITGEQFSDILFASDSTDTRINETKYTQPLIFLTSFSIAKLLIHYGLSPRYMIGHSIGEYVAACISGVMSFDDALKIVIKRGQLMNSLPAGVMLSVSITEAEAKTYLGDGISLAAVNGPEQVVFSGNAESVEKLVEKLNDANIPFVKLQTSHAFHSEMQDPILDSFRAEFSNIQLNKPDMPFISNLTGNIITDTEACSPDYWVRHLRETVRFSEGIRFILSHGDGYVFIESGAGHSLTNLLKQHLPANHHTLFVNLIRPVKEKEDDLRYLTDKISFLWANGVDIDWDKYYTNELRYKISVPTYSFEPVRYPAEVDPMETSMIEDLGLSVAGGLKDSVYYPSWKRIPSLPGRISPLEKRYLFFSHDSHFSATIKQRMEASGYTVTVVFPGTSFEKIATDQYRIDPASPEHMALLVDDLAGEECMVTDILYSWGMSYAVTEIQESKYQFEYFSLVLILQEFLRRKDLKGKKVTVLTDALHKVTGSEQGAYTQALLLGLTSVLPQEYAAVCCNIDIDLREDMILVIDSLLNELKNDSGHTDRIVALRSGYRWMQEYLKNDQSLDDTGARSFSSDKIYLITGGLGNVGFVMTRYLIEHYDATVVLTGRKAIPAGGGEVKEEWLKKLEYLKSISTKVTYLCSDVADITDFRKAVMHIEETLGSVNGVIHTAGIIGDDYFELIEDISIEKTMTMFAPKVTGLENIYTIFGKQDLDFVWITSSLATVLGGLGFASYAAANLFMNHFVSSKEKELPHWKCFAPGGLSFNEQPAHAESSALLPSELTTLFNWNLSIPGMPVIFQSKESLPYRIRKTYQAEKTQYLDDEFESLPIEKLERPLLSKNYTAAETETEIKIKNIFEDFFGIRDIGVEDDFFELGGDSLKGMILLKRLKKEFNVNLSISNFFANPDIRHLAAGIDDILWLSSDVQMENEMTI